VTAKKFFTSKVKFVSLRQERKKNFLNDATCKFWGGPL